MEKIHYERTGETLYTDRLANGLEVYYLPKPAFNKTYGIFTTRFGSLDTAFNQKRYPAGIAHFLEHKLFEKADGDAMYKFGALGAQSNAYTSFNRTAYLFHAREHVAENVRLLLDFVQEPYFTAENVAKEQGIIRQEIQMYQDDPDWRLFSGVLAAMYPNSPLACDIAGTPESIGQITAEMLYTNYTAFYHPANMLLFLTGPFEVDEMVELVGKNQAGKAFATFEVPECPEFSADPALESVEKQMDIALPKLALGLRGLSTLPKGRALYRYRLALQIFFRLIFGRTSAYHDVLYRQGLIDESFGYETELDPRFHLLIFTADTKNPESLAKSLKNRLENYKIDGEYPDFTPARFDLIRRQLQGAFYKSLNSLEYIAGEFANNVYDEATVFDFPEIMSELTIKDVEAAAEQFLAHRAETKYIIWPK